MMCISWRNISKFCTHGNSKTLHVLLKALLPVCMKYTAQGESRVANIVEAKLSAILSPRTIFARDPHQELYISYKRSSSALSVLLYFTLLMCE